MITFCQIWQANNFHFFVSIYRVAVFVHLKNVAKLFFFSMSLFWQKSFSENKNVQKRDMRMPFWAVLGRFGPFYVPFSAKPFFGKQETPILGHASAPFYPQNTVLWHPPKRAKVIFWKQECPKKGHASICIARVRADCTPWKRQKLMSENTNASKRDNRHLPKCQ